MRWQTQERHSPLFCPTFIQSFDTELLSSAESQVPRYGLEKEPNEAHVALACWKLALQWGRQQQGPESQRMGDAGVREGTQRAGRFG